MYRLIANKMEIRKTYAVDGINTTFVVEVEGSTIKSLGVEKFYAETVYCPAERNTIIKKIPYVDKLYLLTEKDFNKVHPEYELSKVIILYRIHNLRMELRDLEILLTFD